MILEVEQRISTEISDFEVIQYYPFYGFRAALTRMEKDFGFTNSAVYYHWRKPESKHSVLEIKRTVLEEWGNKA